MQPVSAGAIRYDTRTIWLHWATALLVVLQWGGAQVIDWFPRGPLRVDARSVHIVLGLALLGIVAVRVVWRATRGRRLPPADRGVLQVVATATHWTLHALVLGVLALGVFNVWVRGDNIFNMFAIPAYDPANRALRTLVQDWHETGANLLLIRAGLHAAAALAHRYVWRDQVLARMRPAAD